MKQRPVKKYLFGIMGTILFVVVAYLLPVPASLAVFAEAGGYTGREAMVAMAALLWAIFWWVGEVLPDWCTALILQCLWIVAAGLKFTTVFAAFSNTTVWLIVGAFSLGAAITRTGLLTRISLKLMHLFPATYRGQVLALMTVGVACGPLMPSSTAKVVLGSKLACSIADLMDFDNESKGRTGLFLASWTGFVLVAPLFLSASFMAYSLLSVLAEEHTISWMRWFVTMLPYGVVLLVGMYFVIMLGYRAEKQSTFSKEKIKERSAALGPINRQEMITLIIMGVCLVFWILEKVTGISAGTVAIIGGVCCFAFGILDKKEISTALPWGFILFMGVALNMGEVFNLTGISQWLLWLVEPLLTYSSSPVVILLLVFLIALAMRFVIASQTAVLTLLTSLLTPVALSVGIHPLIPGLVVYATVSCWLMTYQNPTYMAALESMEGTIKHENTLKAAGLYLALALLAVLVSIPYWTLLGYIA